MAKSLRSKRMRKMRAVKRERYGQKELERLKKVVANDEVQKNVRVLMEEVSEITTTKHDKPKGLVKSLAAEAETKEEEMDDDGSTKQAYSKNKNLRSQYGSYPIWMNQRKINKNKRARKGRPKRK